MCKDSVLIVDDEEHIRELIKFNLEKEGYDVICANNGKEALEMTANKYPSLILLDLMLPEMDGYEVCSRIRDNQDTCNIPIIMITAKCEELDKVKGLDIGADDYITKPFSVKELLARVKAVLRRVCSNIVYDGIKFGDVIINFANHQVVKNNSKVDFTLKEFELLEVLIKNAGKVLTRDFLLEKIWGYEYIGETRTVDVHIRHLRKKIEQDDKNPKYIKTIRGVGYRFNNII